MLVTVRTILGALVPIGVVVGAAGYFMPSHGSRDDEDHNVRTTLIAGATSVTVLAILILFGSHVR
ncbi:hypothetical protein PPN31114_00190 [Pandoraea pneumonica]|uniref:Uncharacterized protein n=1 Tax=Pandoraea pneumonica TaxID=2508299 RepID=A0A5E4RJX3_9BURK|nr:hypothetical protein PPN31114_00190 [Pandoraea pneumonica]